MILIGTGVGGSESEDIEILLDGVGDGQEDNELVGDSCELVHFGRDRILDIDALAMPL